MEEYKGFIIEPETDFSRNMRGINFTFRLPDHPPAGIMQCHVSLKECKEYIDTIADDPEYRKQETYSKMAPIDVPA